MSSRDYQAQYAQFVSTNWLNYRAESWFAKTVDSRRQET